MSGKNILMIGAGRMAEAIISGLVKKAGNLNGKITVTNRSDKERLNILKKKYDVEISSDWEREVPEHDIIILASPPQTQNEQLRIIGNSMSNQLVITVAAGIDATYMEKRLPEGAAVCWIMPNTAAQVGQSMSIYTTGRNINNEHRESISMILSSIGEGEELTEQEVHDLTAITGSAPAFVYSFVEALENAAMANGVSKEQARQLVTKMLSGSAAMLEAGYNPGDLRQQVASPGGSTAEGLKVLEKEGFHGTLLNAVKAVNKHARSQGEE